MLIRNCENCRHYDGAGRCGFFGHHPPSPTVEEATRPGAACGPERILWDNNGYFEFDNGLKIPVTKVRTP